MRMEHSKQANRLTLSKDMYKLQSNIVLQDVLLTKETNYSACLCVHVKKFTKKL